MDKILVEVYVPLIGMSWDIFIPQDVKMHSVLEMVKKAVENLSDNRFVSDENTAICYRDSGAILNINLSAKELELHNGSKLMLI